MLDLKGRTIHKTVEEKIGHSILDLALKSHVDWGFSCTQGTCARCRCLIKEGMEYLSEPSGAEYDRLDPEEMDEGFRLGCQAIVRRQGMIIAVNKTYF